MMKIIFKFIFPAVFLITGFAAFAQQQGQYSQYMMNYYLINPAAGGCTDFADIRAGYRMQWAGLSGSPHNYYLSAHTPVGKQNFVGKTHRGGRKGHHVVGAVFSGQQLGALSHNVAQLTYGYQLPIAQKWTLSLGLSAGINLMALDKEELDFGDNITDPAANGTNVTKLDLGAGMWLYSDKIFMGLSSMQILEPEVSFAEGVPSEGVFNRLYYLTGGYNFELFNTYKVVPSVLVKYTSTAVQVDINTKVKYRDFLWAGISYRRIDAMALLAGVSIPFSKINPKKGNCSRLEVGYSYDFNTSRLNPHNTGSHEIMVALLLPLRSRLVCPSNFW